MKHIWKSQLSLEIWKRECSYRDKKTKQMYIISLDSCLITFCLRGFLLNNKWDTSDPLGVKTDTFVALISCDCWGCSFIDHLNFSRTLLTVFHKTTGNVFSHSSPLMLVKPLYAIDISHWVVRLEIDAQQKDCKAKCTLLPLPLSTTVLLTSSVIPHTHRAKALLTRHPTAPKHAIQADLRYPPTHLRLLNQHCTESPLEACETATSIQQVQTVPLAPAYVLH